MSTPSEVLGKLAKLIKHQESATAIGSLAEAEAFADKIQELLTRHKLEMSDVQFIEQEKTEPIDSEYVNPISLGVKKETKRILWQEDLARAVGYCNDCQILVTNAGNTAYFVGRKSDRGICIQLHTYFLTLIDEISEHEAYVAKPTEKVKYNLSGGTLHHHMIAFREAYATGMSEAIQRRLYERKRTVEASLKDASNTSTALVHLRKTAADIDAWMEDKFGEKEGKKKKAAKDNIKKRRAHLGAYEAGYEKGTEVALTSGALGEGEMTLEVGDLVEFEDEVGTKRKSKITRIVPIGEYSSEEMGYALEGTFGNYIRLAKDLVKCCVA